jgi:hypothetical protein
VVSREVTQQVSSISLEERAVTQRWEAAASVVAKDGGRPVAEDVTMGPKAASEIYILEPGWPVAGIKSPELPKNAPSQGEYGRCRLKDPGTCLRFHTRPGYQIEEKSLG